MKMELGPYTVTLYQAGAIEMLGRFETDATKKEVQCRGLASSPLTIHCPVPRPGLFTSAYTLPASACLGRRSLLAPTTHAVRCSTAARAAARAAWPQ